MSDESNRRVPRDPGFKDPLEELVDLEAAEARVVKELESHITPLPPFLREQVRHREAYLTLIKDVSEVLSQDWNEPGVPITIRKTEINAAIANSLRMWI